MEDMSNTKRKFSSVEDERLRRLAVSCSYNWRQIAKSMPRRTARQCRERYKYFLSPEISQDVWTDEEDRIIQEKFIEYGPKWATIAQHLNGRTAISIKNRYKKLVRHNKKKKRKQQLSANESDVSSSSYENNVEEMKSEVRSMLSLPVPISKLLIFN